MRCLVFVLLSSISWGAENLRMIEWSSILGDAAIQEIVDYRTEARLASLERLADAGECLDNALAQAVAFRESSNLRFRGLSLEIFDRLLLHGRGVEEAKIAIEDNLLHESYRIRSVVLGLVESLINIEDDEEGFVSECLRIFSRDSNVEVQHSVAILQERLNMNRQQQSQREVVKWLDSQSR
jgi:hypothetical protein